MYTLRLKLSLAISAMLKEVVIPLALSGVTHVRFPFEFMRRTRACFGLYYIQNSTHEFTRISTAFIQYY